MNFFEQTAALRAKEQITSKSSLFKNSRAGNLLICSSLIRSFAHFAKIKWATVVSKLLRSLRGYERPWANCSGRSRQMSDHERLDQVAQKKWANEQFAKKIWLKNVKCCFTTVCFIKGLKKKIEKMRKSLFFSYFLFFGERCEWIAHFAHIKWAMWGNRSFCSPKMSNHELFA